ncbi:SUKH-4 family immunity protein [Streptomyces sp. NBC_00347]|uniref:SUKH-4 family immunity protein n=1 Tax=Streptomyces sp. NBC_00347 TaxID=2975721 RepID=UPI00224ED2AA|nr:SUKH-4 family immunity protein [Streptomyces sp. NBC_00347]MCX5122907.1 SUKH-4 family immunity protein [Streptomyces sp. NBC_00347]
MEKIGLASKAAEMLTSGQIPREVMTIFRAVQSPHRPEGDDFEYVMNGVVLGHSREDDEICLDLDTGRILLMASWHPESPLVVNTDLEAFAKSLQTLLALSPLYGDTADLDDAERAEARVRNAIEEIDATSTIDPNGFWSAFLDDVGVGDYRGW